MMMVFLFFGYYYLQKHIDNRFRQKLDKAISEINPYASVAYENVHVNFIGRKVKIDNIYFMPVGTQEKIKIDEFIINRCDVENNLPVRTHFEIRGAHLFSDKALLKSAAPYLLDMGYSDIAVNVELAYTFDSNRNEFFIQNLTFEASGIGKFRLMLNLKGFDVIKIFSGIEDISYLTAAFTQISIDKARLTYDDYSFLKRLVRSDQSHEIQPYIFFVNEASRGIDHAIEKEENMRTKSVLISLRNFIAAPDKISIVANPVQPVPLARFIWIKNLKDLIELLQIKIEI